MFVQPWHDEDDKSTVLSTLVDASPRRSYEIECNDCLSRQAHPSVDRRCPPSRPHDHARSSKCPRIRPIGGHHQDRGRHGACRDDLTLVVDWPRDTSRAPTTRPTSVAAHQLTLQIDQVPIILHLGGASADCVIWSMQTATASRGRRSGGDFDTVGVPRRNHRPKPRLSGSRRADLVFVTTMLPALHVVAPSTSIEKRSRSGLTSAFFTLATLCPPRSMFIVSRTDQSPGLKTALTAGVRDQRVPDRNAFPFTLNAVGPPHSRSEVVTDRELFLHAVSRQACLVATSAAAASLASFVGSIRTTPRHAPVDSESQPTSTMGRFRADHMVFDLVGELPLHSHSGQRYP